MGINQKQFEELLDDIKLISKAGKVVCDENDQVKRQYAFGLLADLVDRLYADVQRMAGKTSLEKIRSDNEKNKS
jgi:hypothetical protein